MENLTIAERIRIEKRNASSFDFSAFMNEIADYFTKRDYGSYLGIKGVSESHIKEFEVLYKNRMRVDVDKKYSILDTISIPEVHLQEALSTLKDEGFFIFKRYNPCGVDYKVSLCREDFVYGISHWSNVTNMI